MNETMQKVAGAMLAIQRYPWEQGVCAQAMYELGDNEIWVAMAHDAILRQKEDGRLAVINENVAVTDPAANGEVCLRAYALTGDEFYRDGAQRMLDYLMKDAPRTDDGVLYHNTVSFAEGFSPNQLWIDAAYMAPPFLAVMGELDEAAADHGGRGRLQRVHQARERVGRVDVGDLQPPHRQQAGHARRAEKGHPIRQEEQALFPRAVDNAAGKDARRHIGQPGAQRQQGDGERGARPLVHPEHERVARHGAAELGKALREPKCQKTANRFGI